MKPASVWIFVAVSAACAVLATVQPSADESSALVDGHVATPLELYAQSGPTPGQSGLAH